MPLSLNAFKAKRREESESFKSHLVPQIDYLVKTIREAIKDLNAQEPKDTERIQQFETMAAALNATAHSGDSIFSLNSTLERSLTTLGELPDFLEANDGSNLKLLQETAKAHPELQDGLPEEDKSKNFLGHIRDVNSFCDLGYGQRMMNRIYDERREQFYSKMHTDNGNLYREYTGRQFRFLGTLLEQAAEDIAKRTGTSTQTQAYLAMGRALNTLSTRGNLNMDDGTINSRLMTVDGLPALLEENNGQVLDILRETMQAHPEIAEGYLLTDELKNKTLAEHIKEAGDYLDLNFNPNVTAILDKTQKELKNEANLRAEVNRQRQEEIERIEHAEKIKNLLGEEDAIKAEDKARQQKEEDQKRLEEEEQAKVLQERQQFRNQNGAFVLPQGYDNRDVAGMFVDSAKQRGEQHAALVRFRNQLRASIEEYTSFAAGEYAKRLPLVMKDMPEEPTEEQRATAIDNTLKSVPAEEREQSLRSYYPDYEARMAQERAKLGADATEDQVSISLYKQALIEQYKDDLRKTTYTSKQIQDAQQEAALELARTQLSQANEQEKQQFEQEKKERVNDSIASQFKTQVIEAYRAHQADFLAAYLPPRVKYDYLRKALNQDPSLARLSGPALDKALYEKRMGELLDICLYDQNNWNNFNNRLANFGTPKSLADPTGQKGPMDVALQNAMAAPNAELAEKEMLLERADQIPQQEIDQLAESKLPLPQTDDQLLYRWARNRTQGQLQQEIRQEYAAQHPDIVAVGIDTLRDLHRQAETITDVCSPVLPENQEDNRPFIYTYDDYNAALKKDQSLTREQRTMLREEYKKYQTELQLNNARGIHPRMLIPEDKELRNQIEQNAALRQGMTEKEKRAEDLKILTERVENARRRQTFLRDFEERRRKAEQERLAEIDNAKNKKVQGKLEGAGNAAGQLFDTLKTVSFTHGPLGDAYKRLDNAFAKGDLGKGKDLREKLGVGPEVKPKQKDPAAGKNVKPEAGNAFVPFKQQAPQKASVKKPARKQGPKKPYVFQQEYIDAQKKKEIKEAAPKNINNAQQNQQADINNKIQQFRNSIPQFWNSLRDERGLSKQALQWRLSSILAIQSLAEQAKKTNNPGLLDFDSIDKEAGKIQKSAAFNKLFEKGAPNYLSEETADKLIDDYKENVKLVSSYRLPLSQQNTLSQRLAPIVDTMERTYSGKIVEFIPRGPLGNSTAYENALAAMKNVMNKKASPDELKDKQNIVSPDETYDSVQTVLKYLDKKETVRKRSFGRVRWEQCMTFLKHTMPPEKFKEYCDHVNTVRGVADDPSHKDYVSPESFGSTVHKEACTEAMDQLKRGKDRPEDYATLFALRKMNPNEPVNKKALTLAKEQILQDPDFQLLTTEKNIGRLKEMAENNQSDYAAQAQALKNNAQPQNELDL